MHGLTAINQVKQEQINIWQNRCDKPCGHPPSRQHRPAGERARGNIGGANWAMNMQPDKPICAADAEHSYCAIALQILHMT
jgi:hypothetical protein